MTMSPNYRVYPKADKVLAHEQARRIRVDGKNWNRNQVLNQLIIEYPQLIKRIHELDK